MTEPHETLLSTDEIQARVAALGKQITEDYQDKDLVVVGVLKGAFVFMSDLIRNIDVPLTCDFLRVSSYKGGSSTGIVRLDLDLSQSITDKDVLLVEDIVDTGQTLRYLLDHLQAKQPASLKVCALLYNAINPKIRDDLDYIGFTIPDCYVVGYGLDINGMYRSLPYVAKLKK
jgi:hypoxanthine phosphoribosyltransferase